MFIALSSDLMINLEFVATVETVKADGVVTAYQFTDVNGKSLGKIKVGDPKCEQVLDALVKYKNLSSAYVPRHPEDS